MKSVGKYKKLFKVATEMFRTLACLTVSHVIYHIGAMD